MANEKETKTVSKTAPKKTTTKKEGTATKKTTATKAKATKEVKAEKVEKVEKVAATKKVEKTPRGEHKVSARTTRLLEKYKTELEVYQLVKNYDEKSWQAKIIQSEMRNCISNINYYTYQEKSF